MKKQFVKFVLVGIASAAVNLAVYNLLLYVFAQISWDWDYVYLVAQLIAFYTSVLATFLLSRRFVFNTPEERATPWLRALVRMCLVYSFSGIVINSLLSILWVQALGLPEQWVTLFNDVCAGPINFLLNKFWSFRGNTKSKTPA